MDSIKEQITMEQLQNLGKEVQEQFNNLTNNLEKNIKQRIVKLGSMEIVTNLPVTSNEEFAEIISNISILGLDVMKLKVLQRGLRCKEIILETEIDCLRLLLSNLKQLRLDMYRELDVQQKSIEVESNVKFNLDEANKEITKYIKKLYQLIAKKRTELARVRESEIVDIDYDKLSVNDLLIEVATIPNNQNNK